MTVATAGVDADGNPYATSTSVSLFKWRRTAASTSPPVASPPARPVRRSRRVAAPGCATCPAPVRNPTPARSSVPASWPSPSSVAASSSAGRSLQPERGRAPEHSLRGPSRSAPSLVRSHRTRYLEERHDRSADRRRRASSPSCSIARRRSPCRRSAAAQRACTSCSPRRPTAIRPVPTDALGQVVDVLRRRRWAALEPVGRVAGDGRRRRRSCSAIPSTRTSTRPGSSSDSTASS